MSKISERIRYVGVKHCEKTFCEGIWPLSFSIGPTSYPIVNKKIALTDTISEGSEKNYLVANHMEPDHSSMISLILDICSYTWATKVKESDICSRET